MGSSVKDKDNLFETNVWSIGEYEKRLPTFKGGSSTSELSGEFSKIGDNSIKHTGTSATGNRWLRYMVQLDQLATINVFSLDIYSPKTQVNVLFAYIDESNNCLKRIFWR